KAFTAVFSPENRLLAFPSFQLGVVRLWHAASNGEIVALKHSTAPHAAAFSADGKTLVVADPHAVRLWDLAGTGEKRVLPGHSRGVAGLAFSPDGRRLASTGNDARVHIWDPATGARLQSLPALRGHIEAVTFSPDGRLLVTGDWVGGIHFWDTQTWQLR